MSKMQKPKVIKMINDALPELDPLNLLERSLQPEQKHQFEQVIKSSNVTPVFTMCSELNSYFLILFTNLLIICLFHVFKVEYHAFKSQKQA